MEDEAKKSTMQQILQTRVLCDKAETDGISLTEEENAKVREAVDAFMENEHLVEVTGATKELAERIYTQNALANKVYETMVQDVDTNVNEEDFLRKTLEYIKISEKEDTTEETTEAETGATEEVSQQETGETEAETESAEDAEMKAKMMEAAESIQSEIEAGTELDAIKEEYKEAEFDVYSFNGVGISAEDTEEYKKTAWNLAAGECSIYEGEDGVIYVLHLLNDKDEEKTQAAIKTEIEKRTAELFQTRYEELTKQAPTFKVKDDVWDSVTFKEAAYEEETTEDTGSETELESEGQETTAEGETQEETNQESSAETQATTETVAE